MYHNNFLSKYCRYQEQWISGRINSIEQKCDLRDALNRSLKTDNRMKTSQYNL